MKKRLLYDEDGAWINTPSVTLTARATELKIEKILKDLFKDGWSRIHVERMLIDHVRLKSAMISLMEAAEKSEKKNKKRK